MFANMIIQKLTSDTILEQWQQATLVQGNLRYKAQAHTTHAEDDHLGI
jgi:hypothetical protein